MSKVLEITMFAPPAWYLTRGVKSRFLPGGYGTESHGHVLGNGHHHRQPEPIRPAAEAISMEPA
jgi:hypothetical protein